jgi:alkanesulfonate monooxygenase SsuD/methylene tetrahydromethanopterin reductase-like flavin-dependent oxidoreductase (luciferase family)
MDVAIGLPNAVPGTSGEQLVAFAREAEARSFSSLGTVDRLVYPGYDPFVALSAAASVTERIRLATSVLSAPYRINAAQLAKDAASLHALSDGRFVLGIALGARDDDYEASGLSTAGRGDRLDSMLDEVKRIWAGEERGYAGAIGPPVEDPPEILVGGGAQASFERAARFGDGWIQGAVGPDQFAANASKVREAWSAAGREGSPKLASLDYFALGPDAKRIAEEDLRHYYAWLGDEIAGQIAASAATDPDSVNQHVSAFEQAGCDELFMMSTGSDPEQATLLAEALGK